MAFYSEQLIHYYLVYFLIFVGYVDISGTSLYSL